MIAFRAARRSSLPLLALSAALVIGVCADCPKQWERVAVAPPGVR